MAGSVVTAEAQAVPLHDKPVTNGARSMSGQGEGLRHLSSRAAYTFPTDKLRTLQDGSRKPLVVVACGSFNPPTYLHLRIFEMAQDWSKYSSDYEVIGGYMSPVGDAYEKAGLVSAHHRIEMCGRAASDSSWIDVDQWEALQDTYQRTAVVLDHFNYEINEKYGGAKTKDGKRVPVHILLLAGADLVDTMNTPGVWSQEDIEKILGQYGVLIVERAGTDVDESIQKMKPQGKDWNIHVIHQLITNDVSSTKVRGFLEKRLSVRYIIPPGVADYIESNRLYEGRKPEDLHEPPTS